MNPNQKLELNLNAPSPLVAPVMLLISKNIDFNQIVVVL
jgi:hypothetical protein